MPERPSAAAAARLDRTMVERGLARSRGQAREMIDAGAVLVDGRPVAKPSTPVDPASTVVLTAPGPVWVGRAAGKLDGFLQAVSIGADHGGEDRGSAPRIAGARCIDIGASTGGFTQVLLGAGARQVIALDVGHGQLVAEVADDPRVMELSGRSVRGLGPDDIGGPVDIAVADLSFISLRLVVPEIRRLLTPTGEAILLVKPQFEVGRHRLGPRGVVLDPAARLLAIRGVVDDLRALGMGIRAIEASQVIGGRGNREYLVWATVGVDDSGAWQALQQHMATIVQEEPS